MVTSSVHEMLEKREQSDDVTGAPATILLVDDEKVARMVTRRKLERFGYRVIEAEHGGQALERLKEQPISLVVTDWLMPEMDGPTLVEAVKADESLQTIHMILMTGLDQPDQIAEGLRRGADDFLTKSASDQEILARVNAGLRAHRLVQELRESHRTIMEQQTRLLADLQAGARFVRSLLPNTGIVCPGVVLDWRYLPSAALGGDLFQVVVCDEDRIGIVILDMSGHGIGPALRAVSLSRMFTPHLIQQWFPSCDPGLILQTLTREYPMSEDGEYFTMWMGVLKVSTRELQYATAGHPGAIVTKRMGTIDNLGDQTLPIGFSLDQEYKTHTYHLDSGDRLHLFSDGLYEVQSSGGALWGIEGLHQACQRVHNQPLDKALAWILQQSQTWQRRTDFDDDVALVGLDLQG